MSSRRLKSKTKRKSTASPLSILIVIPAYNEERFIGSIVLQARDYGTVVVVDDGSSDHTSEIATRAGATVLRHKVNCGKGAALNTGFRYAKGIPSDVVVTIDGDGQHLCSDIIKMVTPVLEGKADLVIGSRFLGTKSRIPRWRIFGQQALTVATNLSSGSHLTDSQSGYRAFSPSILEMLNFDTEDFSVESEMQFLAKENNLRILEVPISVLYVEPSKRNPINQGLQVINGIIRLVSSHRPLLFFGGGGLLILFLGLLWGGYVVDIYVHQKILPIGYTLICVLLAVIGSTSFFTGLMLHSISGLMRDLKKTIERSQKKE